MSFKIKWYCDKGWFIGEQLSDPPAFYALMLTDFVEQGLKVSVEDALLGFDQWNSDPDWRGAHVGSLYKETGKRVVSADYSAGTVVLSDGEVVQHVLPKD